MLDEFIAAERDVIIGRARERVASRKCPQPTNAEVVHGVPLFLDQLCDALRLARSGGADARNQLETTARSYGHELLQTGLTISQVVHAYGDICQAITQLAIEREAAMSPDEFRILNSCLDDAIAQAVTGYSEQQQLSVAARKTERLGEFAHELRNLLSTAVLTFDSIKSGQVGASGSTAAVHDRCLTRLRHLIDRSLAEVRLDAGIDRTERIVVSDFLEDLEIGGLLQARAKGLHFGVTSVERTLTIVGDREVLAAAVENLLQNAFKFTRDSGHVLLRTAVTSDRVAFEVEDECGGLPPGKHEELFRAYEQRGRDRTGLGLGLSICLHAAKANNGQLRVRDVPGRGCVFALEVPRGEPTPA